MLRAFAACWTAAFTLMLAPVPAAASATRSPSAVQPGVDRSAFGAQSVWPGSSDLMTILERMEHGGIRWARFDLCWWGLAEYSPGQFNFVNPPDWPSWNTDAAIDAMRARGIEPFPILCYGNRFYDNNQGPFSDSGRAAFAEYCYQAALRYRDKVTVWEVWNEPNQEFFWGRPPDPADYARLVIAAAPRIREANPDAVVVGGATSGVDLAFLRTAFDYGLLDAVDVISVHPYRIAPPESADAELAALRDEIARRTSRPIAVWSGEWGYNTWWSEVTPLGQAKCLSRMMINNYSQGIGLSIWFSTHAFVEASGDAHDPEWGLLDYDYNPRPSFFAMQTLNARLPAPLRPVADPFQTVISPLWSGTRSAFFERGDPGHVTLAVWLARWPLSDSFGGRTTSISLAVAEQTAIRAFSSLNSEPVPLDITRQADRFVLRNFQIMDYPILIEIEAAAGPLVPRQDIVEHVLERAALPPALEPFADYNANEKIEVGDVILAPETVY
ncbi:MAG: hypothetical protein Kow0059_21730 [Candidatus Sumerlaeia bacterium]